MVKESSTKRQKSVREKISKDILITNVVRSIQRLRAELSRLCGNKTPNEDGTYFVPAFNEDGFTHCDARNGEWPLHARDRVIFQWAQEALDARERMLTAMEREELFFVTPKEVPSIIDKLDDHEIYAISRVVR